MFWRFVMVLFSYRGGSSLVFVLAMMFCTSLTGYSTLFASSRPAAVSHLPASVADLIEQVQDKVVSISAVHGSKSGRASIPVIPKFPHGSPFHDFFEDLFGGTDDMLRSRPVHSQGSGFFVAPGGVVLTNNHVVAGAKEITVILHDGRKFDAEIVGVDTKLDLAVLKIDSSERFPTVKWADSSLTRVGDFVVAIGNPLGLGNSVSYGMISACNRKIGVGSYDNFFQTDAAMNRGSSGGPLINMNGEVVGINTAIAASGNGGGSIGIGFSQASNTIKPVVFQLIQYGEPIRAWLGVVVQEITDKLLKAIPYLSASGEGALVASVTKDGPAHHAGIKYGDIIIKFDGRGVKDVFDLTRMVASSGVSEEVLVVVLRDGKEIPFKVKLGRLPGDRIKAPSVTPEEMEIERISGLVLGPMDRSRCPAVAEVGGLTVVKVARGSDAEEEGIRPGDMVLEIGGHPVAAVEDAEKAFRMLQKRGDSHALLLVVGGKCVTRFVSIDVFEDD